jgi:hypothetical protein
MLPKLSAFISFASLFAGCVIPTYFGSTALNDIQTNQKEITMHKVLIVGAGSMASRLFLENISSEMMKVFTSKGVESNFLYVGEIPRGTQLKLDTVISSKYDGYIIFNPKDTSYFNARKEKYIAIVPGPLGTGFSAGGYGNQYKEEYFIEAYVNDSSLSLIWRAGLKLNFDFSAQYKYKHISNDIFDQLKINKISFK